MFVVVGGTSVDPKRINMKAEGFFANSDTPLEFHGPPDQNDLTVTK